MSEENQIELKINGKEVSLGSLEVDGVDPRDYPDFADVFFSSGEFIDGTPLSEEDLDYLNEHHGDLAWDYAFQDCIGQSDYDPYDD